MALNKKFWQNKKVLITGHEGFLGSNLAKTLLEANAEVIGIDKVLKRPLSVLNGSRRNIKSYKADVSDLSVVKKIAKKEKPQIVFHLAAEAIVGRAKQDPINVFLSNIQGTWNVLEACRLNKRVRGIVVASSDKAYGTAKKLPYTEHTVLAGKHVYDASKVCADTIAASYYYCYDLPVCVTRCGNIYGPGDFNFSRLIPDAIKCALKKKRLIIRSNGKFIRDYVYIDDIVSGYVCIAENIVRKKLSGEAFNLSGQKPYKVMDIVKKIRDISGPSMLEPIIQNRANDEIKEQFLSASKIQKKLHWRPFMSIDDGLKETVNWYKDRI